MVKEYKLKPYEIEPNVVDFLAYKDLNSTPEYLPLTFVTENGEEYYEVLSEEEAQLLDKIMEEISFPTLGFTIDHGNDNW